MIKKYFTSKNLRFWLFLILILMAPLSKYPSISTPEYNFAAFRLGLYQILAAIFLVFCIIPLTKKLKELYVQNKIAIIGIVLLGSVAIFGLGFSIYKARSALLVVSIVFLLILVLCSWWFVRYDLNSNRYNFILKLVLIAGIVFSVAGLFQLLLSTFTNNTFGILCSGCVASVLGFPRINVFAAEPEFYANAMLPFFFIAMGIYYNTKHSLSVVTLLLTSLVIFLSFSRGAFAAIIVGVIFFILLIGFKQRVNLKRILTIIVMIFIGCAVGALLLIGSAYYRYHSTPNIVYNTTRTMLDQATNGLIILPTKTNSSVIKSTNTFVSPGLIKASGEDRLSAARLAIQAWSYDTKTVVFGVGAGNLGPFVNKHINKSTPSNLTVYTYYALLLTEIGLIGLTAFILIYLAGLFQFIKNIRQTKYLEIFVAIASLTVAFLVQYWFFGTYINTVYIWLWLGIILGLAGLPLNKKLYNQKSK